MNEYPIAQAWRDARVQPIYGGTNEIMKEIIGRVHGPVTGPGQTGAVTVEERAGVDVARCSAAPLGVLSGGVALGGARRDRRDHRRRPARPRRRRHRHRRRARADRRRARARRARRPARPDQRPRGPPGRAGRRLRRRRPRRRARPWWPRRCPRCRCCSSASSPSARRPPADSRPATPRRTWPTPERRGRALSPGGLGDHRSARCSGPTSPARAPTSAAGSGCRRSAGPSWFGRGVRRRGRRLPGCCCGPTRCCSPAGSAAVGRAGRPAAAGHRRGASRAGLGVTPAAGSA